MTEKSFVFIKSLVKKLNPSIQPHQRVTIRLRHFIQTQPFKNSIVGFTWKDESIPMVLTGDGNMHKINEFNHYDMTRAIGQAIHDIYYDIDLKELNTH